jgi:arsenite-transporting ATPase
VRELLARKLLFVGGKGGVGKTTVASALALAAAVGGRSCLVVSTDLAHSLGDIFGREIGDREVMLAAGVSGLEIDPDRQAGRHIEAVKQGMRSLVRPDLYAEVDRQMDLARHAPGAQEAALLERVADIVGEATDRYDLVVFDTAPTGQTLRLLSLPEAMAAWTEGLLARHRQSEGLARVFAHLGRAATRGAEQVAEAPADAEGGDPRLRRVRDILLARRRKFHRARRLMLDRATTAFVWVLTPEKLPILETGRALHLLARFDLPVAWAVVNRVLPADAEGDFLAQRRRQEAERLAEIDRMLGALPRTYLPLLAEDVHGLEALERVGRLLLTAPAAGRREPAAPPPSTVDGG